MKNLRQTAAFLFGVVAVLALFAVESHYMGNKSLSFSNRLFVFVLLNLNLLALLVLMFFVGKNLLRIYLDKRRKVPGYKFKTRLVVVLVVLTMIPSAFLFIVSSGVITRYLDRWFDPQLKQTLNLSVSVAKAAYEQQGRHTLAYAKALASGRHESGDFVVTRLSEVPPGASEVMKAAFEGRADVEVISGGKGDLIRAAAPIFSHGKVTGVTVVESVMSSDISRKADEIKEANKNFRNLESWKTPITANYLFILGFFTLLTVFMALWVALRIAKGITDPIQMLAQKTGEVASGNFEINIDVQRDDEIGVLVASFNNMVRQLKEGKESLQRAWTVSERRRLIIENIVANINSGVIFLDTEGTILTLNNAACRILEVAPSEMINRNYSELLAMLKSEELRDTVKSIRVYEFKGIEKELRVRAGSRSLLLRVFITTLGDAENFIGTLAVFDDITEIVRAQKALAWQEVARRIAHEIKNPLTPIKLSTEHMIKKWTNRDEDFDRTFERASKTIIKEVESLRRLVNEFSMFGKMPEIKKAPARLSAIIEGVINLYRDYKDLGISFERPSDEPAVDVDSEQFKRVIINIVENAIQAMRGKGAISIRLTYPSGSGMAYVDVADNGPGIREEDREKLFMPYFSTKKDGTGLGLAIAGRVITEHRGYIRVKDNRPSGTVFTIELPIKEN